MSVRFSQNAVTHDHALKTKTLVFEIEITGNATPASKSHDSDLRNVAFLRTEGKVAEADAIEDLSSDFTAADDATGVFGLLIDGSEVGIGDIEKVLKVETFVQSGTLAASSPSNGSDVTDFLTTEGNIAIELDSSVDLSAANLTGTIEVVFKENF